MNPVPDPAATTSFRRLGLLVFLGVLALSIPQAALLPLLDRDEPRFAEASREMLQSGNFIVPTFNRAPRYAKPPLIYWCQAVSFSILGENAFSARLPSLLATAGTALLLFAWAAALGSIPAGLIAGFGYAFCFQAVQQGRVATADALLIFFMTLTVFAGGRLLGLAKGAAFENTVRRWNVWGTVLALGFAGGFLAKGPEAWLPLAPLVVRAWPCRPRVLLALAAIFALSLLLVASWAVPAFIETHGDYWREGLGHDVGDRMVTGFQGHGASTFGWYILGLPLYFLLFWLSALPWSPLLIAQWKRLFAVWKPDAVDAYLLLNAGLIFLVFSLMVTKLPHYTLPAFPFLALLFARRWIASGLRPGLPFGLSLGWGVLLAVLAAFLIPLSASRVSFSAPQRLVEQARGAIPPQTEFALVDFQEPSAIWEMRRVTQGFGQVIDASKVIAFLSQPGPRAVLISSKEWAKLSASPETANSWHFFAATGWNTAKGRRMELRLVVKE